MQSDRAAAIMAAAMLERSLEHALATRFVSGNSDITGMMFGSDGRGPFGSLDAKVKGAIAFGLIGIVTKKDRKIRNDFSHWKPKWKESLTFNSNTIKDRCDQLVIPTFKLETDCLPETPRDKYMMTVSVCCMVLAMEATQLNPERPKLNKTRWEE